MPLVYIAYLGLKLCLLQSASRDFMLFQEKFNALFSSVRWSPALSTGKHIGLHRLPGSILVLPSIRIAFMHHMKQYFY